MWIIDKKDNELQATNTKTGAFITVNSEKFVIETSTAELVLEIPKAMYTKVPMEVICEIYDSLENFKYMDTKQVEEYFMEEMLGYIETKNNKELVEEGITTEEFLKEYGFETLEKALTDGDIHVEKTEQDMKLWFLEDIQTGEILDILEGKQNTNYDTWEYLIDRDLWVFVYC